MTEHREIQSVEFEFGPEKGETEKDGLEEFNDNSFGFKSKINGAYDNLELLEMHSTSTKETSGDTLPDENTIHGNLEEPMLSSQNGGVVNSGFRSNKVAKGMLGTRSQSLSSSRHYFGNLSEEHRSLSMSSKHSSRRPSMHELTEDDEVTDGGVYYRSPRTTQRNKVVGNIKYIKQTCDRPEKRQNTNISKDSCNNWNSCDDSLPSVRTQNEIKPVIEGDSRRHQMVDISIKHEDKNVKTGNVVATFAHQISNEFNVNVQTNSGNTLDNNHGTDDWVLEASNNHQNNNKSGQVVSSMNHQKSINVILDVHPSLVHAVNKDSTGTSSKPVDNSASTQDKHSGKSQIFRSSLYTQPKEVTMDVNSSSGETRNEGNRRVGQVVVSSNSYQDSYNRTDQVQSVSGFEAITMEIETGTSKDLNASYPNSAQNLDASECNGDRDEEANQGSTSLDLKRFVNVIKMDLGGAANEGEMNVQKEVVVSNGSENGNANGFVISSNGWQGSTDITVRINMTHPRI